VDLLLGSTTGTLTREAVLKVQFPGVLFYDGHGFMVPTAANIDTLPGLNGGRVCVEKGTTNERTLDAYFQAQGWSVEPVVIDSAPKAAEALFAGRCAAYTADAAQLAAMGLRAPGGPQALAILPERISREPLSPAVWGGDPEWTTTVRWVLNVLILADITASPATTSTPSSPGGSIPGCGRPTMTASTSPRPWAFRPAGPAGCSGRSATTARSTSATSGATVRSRSSAISTGSGPRAGCTMPRRSTE
jgi:hypothetical protein